MHVLILLAHPQPGSFNHAIADTVRATLEAAGHTVDLRDLYAEGFDPLYTAEELKHDHVAPPQVREHLDAIKAAEAIVVVHPNWWGQPPAILKGWLDRVLTAGEAYRFGTNDKGEGVIISLLTAEAALVFTTSNTPREFELSAYGDPLENFWVRVVWGFFGIPKIKRRNFEPVVVSTPEQRKGWLDEVARLTREVIG